MMLRSGVGDDGDVDEYVDDAADDDADDGATPVEAPPG
jgi:hypothetical protein